MARPDITVAAGATRYYIEAKHGPFGVRIWCTFDESADRRWRRVRTHVHETHLGSRMHAAYRRRARHRTRRRRR